MKAMSHIAWPDHTLYPMRQAIEILEREREGVYLPNLYIARGTELYHNEVSCAEALYFDTVNLKSDGRVKINEKQKVGYKREYKCGPGYARTEGSRLEEP